MIDFNSQFLNPKATKKKHKRIKIYLFIKSRLNILYKACAGHTGGRNPFNDTVACCWEADRLDLRRVGIVPDLQWFYSDAAIEMVSKDDYFPIDG